MTDILDVCPHLLLEPYDIDPELLGYPAREPPEWHRCRDCGAIYSDTERVGGDSN